MKMFDAKISQVFAALFLTTYLLTYDPPKWASLCRRTGVLHSVIALSGIAAVDTAGEGRTGSNSRHSCPETKQEQNNNVVTDFLRSTDTLAKLKHAEAGAWLLIRAQFDRITPNSGEQAAPGGVLVNITALIHWLCSRVGAQLLSAPASAGDEKLSSVAAVAAALGTATVEVGPVDTQALISLRELLLSPESLTPFEIVQSGILQSLCQYLFGAVVPTHKRCRRLYRSQKPRSISFCQLPNHTRTQRLRLLIKELCMPDTASANAGAGDYDAIWSSFPLLRLPADVRPILQLSKLLVGCVDTLQRLPLTLLAHTASASIAVSSLDADDSCCPAHLCLASSDKPPKALAETQPGLSVALPRLSVEFAGDLKLRGFNPQDLFDYLATELKLQADVSIGDTVTCLLRFPPNAQDPDSTTSPDEINGSDRVLCARTNKILAILSAAPKETDSSGDFVPGLPRCVVTSCHVVDPTTNVESSAGDGIRLVLQLCIDIRTTAAMLQQSLAGHVERQIRWLNRRKESQGISGDEKPADDPGSTTPGSTAVKSGGRRNLTACINGHVVPAHMTLGEGLCRFSNVVFVPNRSFTSPSFIARQKCLSRPKSAYHGAMPHWEDCVGAHDGSQVFDPQINPQAWTGTWIALNRDADFRVCSEQNENYRSLVLGIEKQPSGVSTSRRNSTLSEDSAISDALLPSSDSVSKYRPMWETEHKLSANLTTEQDQIAD
eukprot:284817399_2